MQAQSHAEIQEFHAHAHTYRYRLRDGGHASSRLDRWYVSKSQYAAVACTQTMTPASPSDHDAVLLSLTPTGYLDTSKRTGRRAIVYPLPLYATAAIQAVSEAHVVKLQELVHVWTPADAAAQWDGLKVELRRGCLVARRLAAKRMTNGINQRIRRASRALEHEKRRSLVMQQAPVDGADAMEILSTRMELLTLDSGDRVSALRRHLILLQHTKATRRQCRVIHQYDGHSASVTRAFYRRMSGRFSKPRVVRGSPNGEQVVAASQLAADWLPIIQQRPVDVVAQEAFFARIHTATPGSAALAAFDDFAVDEVLSAIAACPVGKANYKIFSRLVLQRIQRRVGELVSPAQFGFVANRQVHDAIDVWEAVQALVVAGELPAETTAVMLDFAKAYDTLDRGFLRRALEFHGFAPHVVCVVDAMHLATTARFLADGDLSDQVDILNGIRQGCPLAPVLFVLALDLLYKAADSHMGLTGLRLDASTRVTLCGFADDTTAYLATPREEAPLLELLEVFGAASGLKINVQKSCAIAVHPQGPTMTHDGMRIPVLAAHELHRHLGMAVASKPSVGSIWTRTLQQVRATLHNAHVKTTNLLQRVAICKAVIMPKLLFVGRHACPSGSVFDQLQRFIHNYAWHASLAASHQRQRAWMSHGVASLPVAAGGFSLPDVRSAFTAMSKVVVTRWCTSTNPVAAAAGSILRRLRGGGPEGSALGASRQQHVAPRLASTLPTTGVSALRASSASPRDAAEVRLLGQLLPVTGRGRVSDRWWQGGWYYCKYESQAADLAALRAHQRHVHGDFNLEALLAAPLVGSGILHSSNGTAIRHCDFRRFIPRGAAIGEVLRIERVDKGLMRFRSRQHPWPISPRYVYLFRRLCDLVVHNYPGVLLPHNAVDELQPRPPSATVWRTRQSPQGTLLVYEPVAGRSVALGLVHNMAAATKLARTRDPTLFRFDPHPRLDVFAPLWTRRRDQAPQSAVPPAVSRQAHAEVASRASRAVTADPVIAQALATVPWTRLARLPASASAQRLLFHKIKGQRLSGWNHGAERRGCPHCPSLSGAVGGHVFHTVWHCPAAQALWTVFCDSWARLGVLHTPNCPRLCSAVFSLRLPRTPAVVWSFLGLRGVPDDLIPMVHEVVAVVWQQQVLGCLQRIWQWRNMVHDAELPWTQGIATATMRGTLRAAYQQALRHVSFFSGHQHALGLLLLGLERLQLSDAPAPVPRAALPSDRFLLFFDGGSRGNPGPGGAGAVVVRVTTHGSQPHLVWAAAMSLSQRTTTNNQAEYVGLVTGLRFASSRHLRPLTVIGDSAMIINQLSRYKARKDERLRRLYDQARILADVIGVDTWCHHLRAYNKMADYAANIAMDTRHSFQTLLTAAHMHWAPLSTHLHGDVEHWQATTTQGHSDTS